MAAPIRWGIMGLGRIAEKFAADLAVLPDATLVACGSRDRGRSLAFAERWQIAPERAHGGYDALARDPGVDVVYVATPHSAHAECAYLCADAGKAVLCEKPVATSAAEATAMFDRAARADTFLMEAMWTRFSPQIARAKQWITDGRIGDVGFVSASFSYKANFEPAGRLFAPSLAGGGLLDVGVYTVALPYMLLGAPDDAHAVGRVGRSGVDEFASLTLHWRESAAVASVQCGVGLDMPCTATIYGTNGRIELPNGWWSLSGAELFQKEGTKETFEIPAADRPRPDARYHLEIAEVHRCLHAGLKASDAWRPEDAVAVLRVLDAARADLGLPAIPPALPGHARSRP